MLSVFILSTLASLVIYLGLIIFNNLYLTFFLFYGIICLAIPTIDFFLIKKYPVKKIKHLLGFLNFKKSVFKGIFIGLVFFLIIYYFFALFSKHIVDNQKINILMKHWNFNKNHILLFLFIMIFANSILEEVYWRGYIFCKFKSKLNIKYVVLFTSLFYSSYHLITTIYLFNYLYGILFTLAIFLVGIFWGYIRTKYNSIYLPIISHLFVDSGIMAVYLKYIY